MGKDFRVTKVRVCGQIVPSVMGRLRIRRDADGLLDWELAASSPAELPRVSKTGTAEIQLADGRSIFGVYDFCDVGIGDRASTIELRGHGTVTDPAGPNCLTSRPGPSGVVGRGTTRPLRNVREGPLCDQIEW